MKSHVRLFFKSNTAFKVIFIEIEIGKGQENVWKDNKRDVNLFDTIFNIYCVNGAMFLNRAEFGINTLSRKISYLHCRQDNSIEITA